MIVAAVGIPEKLKRDWRCYYEIRGLQAPIVGFAPGIDSMQALQLAIAHVARALRESDEDVRWFRTGSMRTGFPLWIPETLGREFETKIEKLIRREQHRQNLKAERQPKVP